MRFEFVVDENSTRQAPDVASSPSDLKVQMFSRWLKGPSIYSTRILPSGAVEGHAASKLLSDRAITYGHIGD